MVNTGHGVPNTSCIKLQRGDEVLEDVAIGTGPLDASFKAINRMLGMEEAGELQPQRRHRRRGRRGRGRGEGGADKTGGRACTGTGISTDIIESSIRAYVNGINKMMEAAN
ncbi:MAG: alpha-isopropylmalate synthase regulatory domain-containing protein [Dysosmobacter sp.]